MNSASNSETPFKQMGSNEESRGKTQSSLFGRVAIIIGGAGAIGGAVSRQLASLGANIVINYLGDSSQADILVDEINQSNSSPHQRRFPRALSLHADITDEAQVKTLFDEAERVFSPDGIHIIVNCAGIIFPEKRPISEITTETWDRIFLTNAKGNFLCCREASRRIVEGGGGRIITMSSSTVRSLRAGYGAYAASKAAVETLTKILSKELAGKRITVNAVCPGPIATPMFFEGKSEEDIRKRVAECPLNRLGHPEDVARLVGFLASDEGEFVNGQAIRINGGYV